MAQIISTFRDLQVYQLGFELQQEIFRISKHVPADERYSLVDQIRRSSRSVGANIAEAWHKRAYMAHFVSKLTDADAEQAETQHWLGTALACEYLSEQTHRELFENYLRVGQKLGSMIAAPEKFCRNNG